MIKDTLIGFTFTITVVAALIGAIVVLSHLTALHPLVIAYGGLMSLVVLPIFYIVGVSIREELSKKETR